MAAENHQPAGLVGLDRSERDGLADEGTVVELLFGLLDAADRAGARSDRQRLAVVDEGVAQSLPLGRLAGRSMAVTKRPSPSNTTIG
jgi:hypothetical protein